MHTCIERVVSLSQKQHLFLLYISIVYGHIAYTLTFTRTRIHKHTQVYIHIYPWNQLPSFYVPRTGTKIQHSILGVENVRTNICVISVFSVYLCVSSGQIFYLFSINTKSKKNQSFHWQRNRKKCEIHSQLVFVSATKLLMIFFLLFNWKEKTN